MLTHSCASVLFARSRKRYAPTRPSPGRAPLLTWASARKLPELTAASDRILLTPSSRSSFVDEVPGGFGGLGFPMIWQWGSAGPQQLVCDMCARPGGRQSLTEPDDARRVIQQPRFKIVSWFIWLHNF